MKAVGYGVWENDKLKIQFGSYSYHQLHTSDAVAEKKSESKKRREPKTKSWDSLALLDQLRWHQNTMVQKFWQEFQVEGDGQQCQCWTSQRITAKQRPEWVGVELDLETIVTSELQAEDSPAGLRHELKAGKWGGGLLTALWGHLLKDKRRKGNLNLCKNKAQRIVNLRMQHFKIFLFENNFTCKEKLQEHKLDI